MGWKVASLIAKMLCYSEGNKRKKKLDKYYGANAPSDSLNIGFDIGGRNSTTDEVHNGRPSGCGVTEDNVKKCYPTS